MAIAWGILVPLAIGSVFLRNHIALLKTNARWLRVHHSLATLAAILTGAGYAVAIMAESRDEDGRFAENERFDDDFHSLVGIVILALVFIQIIAGFVRPKPVVVPVENNTEEVFEDEEKHAQDSNEMDQADRNDGSDATTTTTTSTTTTKFKTWSFRKLWEYTHRLFGMLLIGLAWFNCHTGFFLFAEYYGPIDNLLKLFWGVTGSLSVTIAAAGCLLRLLF
eukprot:CAMPEP_0116132728 /NCGR_PEP_ID=MMETSP0329-20121206/9713_1 /TAXON_ID=697910 /ORGANISM="Pseudo-nitzschia arenysensis, Strain B593" /LENGTH=221 /DNA_ID=CAMNT_0003627283 /DNA_START=160 /DNA_END=825 /DNA_ORIENTATION=-